MTSTKKYNISIATLLLAVYAFIATPVQLWHHHSYVAGVNIKNNISESNTQATCNYEQQRSVDADCSFCSHLYSVYSFVSGFYLKTPFFELQPKNAVYTTYITMLPFFNATNKDPPVLAA